MRIEGKKRDDDVGVGHLKVSTGTKGGVMLSIHMHSSSWKQQEKKYRVKNIKSRVLFSSFTRTKKRTQSKDQREIEYRVFSFLSILSCCRLPWDIQRETLCREHRTFCQQFTLFEFREYTLKESMTVCIDYMSIFHWCFLSTHPSLMSLEAVLFFSTTEKKSWDKIRVKAFSFRTWKCTRHSLFLSLSSPPETSDDMRRRRWMSHSLFKCSKEK